MITVFCIGAAPIAQSPQTQAPPVFRGGIELRRLDVTVRDKQRRPVRGLTAADFMLLEDNVPQKIEAFSFVDVPDVVTEGPVWSSKVAGDITSNQVDSARTFAIVIDDVGGAGGLWAAREMKTTVARFVEQLRPDDMAALVFPGQSLASQDFTRDHAKLVAAAEAYNLTPVGAGPVGAGPGPCEPVLRLPRTLLYVVDHLGSVRGQRRVIAYFGGNLNLRFDPNRCGLHYLVTQLFEHAQQQHVSIYAIDTAGLRVNGNGAIDDYLTLSNETGGHALVNSNALQEGVDRIFAENNSYYLVAYQPTNSAADGRFRQVTVKVNRPGVEVTATRNYWADKPPTAKEVARVPSPELESLAGLFPVSELPLRAVATPFAVAGGPGAVAAVTVSLTQPGFAGRTIEDVELTMKAFTSDGDERGSDRQSIPITIPAVRAPASESRYEILARVDLPKPGSYELRLSVHSAATDKRGSVYVDVDVPDFQNAPVSLSGVAFSSALTLAPVAPPRLLRDVLPLVPTTERAFVTTDAVTAFLRVYQGTNIKPAAIPLKVTIQNAAGKTVFDKTDTLAADRFSAEHAADYQFRVPLATLKPGEYLLTFDAGWGKTPAKRDVRFQVR